MSRYDGHDNYLQSYRDKKSSGGGLRDVLDWLLALALVPTLTRIIFVAYDPGDVYARLVVGICAFGVAVVVAVVSGFVMLRSSTEPGTRLFLEMLIAFSCLVFLFMPLMRS